MYIKKLMIRNYICKIIKYAMSSDAVSVFYTESLTWLLERDCLYIIGVLELFKGTVRYELKLSF